jgi:hypothetical protein
MGVKKNVKKILKEVEEIKKMLKERDDRVTAPSPATPATAVAKKAPAQGVKKEHPLMQKQVTFVRKGTMVTGKVVGNLGAWLQVQHTDAVTKQVTTSSLKACDLLVGESVADVNIVGQKPPVVDVDTTRLVAVAVEEMEDFDVFQTDA